MTKLRVRSTQRSNTILRSLNARNRPYTGRWTPKAPPESMTKVRVRWETDHCDRAVAAFWMLYIVVVGVAAGFGLKMAGVL